MIQKVFHEYSRVACLEERRLVARAKAAAKPSVLLTKGDGSDPSCPVFPPA